MTDTTGLIGTGAMLRWFQLSVATLRTQCDHLSELDSRIGDADHGHNMLRGFERIDSALAAVADKDYGTILKTAGMALLGAGGGISGPLYGTLFLGAATEVAGKTVIDLTQLARMLRAGVDAMAVRGKTRPGDKTLCDVWWPVVAALESAATAGLPLAQALADAEQAASQSLAAINGMQARKGRASSLGAGSIGHQDPGAASAVMLVACLRAALSE